jgi:hypothetical protein
MQPRSILFAHCAARFDLVALCVALAASGCSFHGHSEFHSGTGGDNSAGGEHESASAHQEPAAHEHHEGHHSSAGRDNVVRVTGSKPAVEQGGGAEEPARTAVHPTGDVPPRSSGATEGAAAGGGSDGSVNGGSGAGSGDGSAAAESKKPSESTAEGGAAPAEEAPSSTSKGTRKSPSEPHVTAPTHTKPRKVHRTSSSTNKEGGHE